MPRFFPLFLSKRSVLLTSVPQTIAAEREKKKKKSLVAFRNVCFFFFFKDGGTTLHLSRVYLSSYSAVSLLAVPCHPLFFFFSCFPVLYPMASSAMNHLVLAVLNGPFTHSHTHTPHTHTKPGCRVGVSFFFLCTHVQHLQAHVSTFPFLFVFFFGCQVEQERYKRREQAVVICFIERHER